MLQPVFNDARNTVKKTNQMYLEDTRILKINTSYSE